MYKTSKKQFGEYIRKVREEKGISREELAKRLYVTVGAVCKWENGMRYPDFETLGNLAAELGISTQDIYDNSKEKKDSVNKIINVISIVLLLGALASGIIFGVMAINKRGGSENDNTIVGTNTENNEHYDEETNTENSENCYEGRALRVEISGTMRYVVNHIHDTLLYVDIEGMGLKQISSSEPGAENIHTGDKVRIYTTKDDSENNSVLIYPGNINNIDRIEVIESGSRNDVQTTIDRLVEEGYLIDATCACVDDEDLKRVESMEKAMKESKEQAESMEKAMKESKEQAESMAESAEKAREQEQESEEQTARVAASIVNDLLETTSAY